MGQEKKIKWGAVAITIAILVLAISIIFTGVKITGMMRTGIRNIESELKDEVRREVRKEVLSFIHAYRSAAVENRRITFEDLEKGYQFAEDFLSR